MANVVATVLMALPVGFIAGWIIAKTMFRMELHKQQSVADERLKRTRAKYRAWRERIRPVAVQFRQQRKIITELRDELRRRDLEKQEAEQRQSVAAAAPTGRKSEPRRASNSRLDTVS